MRLIAILIWAIVCAGGEISFQQKPEETNAPDIEVVSAKWAMHVGNAGLSNPSAGPSQTIQRSGEAQDPMPVIVPNPKVSARATDHTMYTYSTTIFNRGQKDIRALAWDYVFRDRVTQAELKRLKGYSAARLGRNQKSMMQFKTYSSPPKVINANSADGKPYDELIIIQCVLFRDGSMWTHPKADPRVCETLRSVKSGRSGNLSQLGLE